MKTTFDMINNTIAFIGVLILVGLCIYVNIKPKKEKPTLKPKIETIEVSKDKMYRIYLDSYFLGYKSAKYAPKIKRSIPFEIEIQRDSIIIFEQYWKP